MKYDWPHLAKGAVFAFGGLVLTLEPIIGYNFLYGAPSSPITYIPFFKALFPNAMVSSTGLLSTFPGWVELIVGMVILFEGVIILYKGFSKGGR